MTETEIKKMSRDELKDLAIGLAVNKEDHLAQIQHVRCLNTELKAANQELDRDIHAVSNEVLRLKQVVIQKEGMLVERTKMLSDQCVINDEQRRIINMKRGE